MSNPAPGPLEHVRAFVNTRDVDEETDELSGPAELASWLGAHKLLGDSAPGDGGASVADVRRAVELREALRAHLRAHHGEPLQAGAAEVLDEAARRAALTVRFTSLDESALGRLLAVVAGAIEDGTWRRLKVCPADDCQWAFYDESRNRSATWCDMKVCGNRAKVRTFRERTRPGEPDARN
jgi:predicted RNA-binding Zn ribbon-like protein